ncbi:hypothetical protein ENUP19_0248G0023 [Entamoeba nuttalli]|uniref:4-methyl-5(B-hydroxyethyl)-thiazol monophosphate biosynthesis enzyme, putative n=2 Tax=Entamoeba nuttalli TaxID=412467 RepID=K2H2K2_ENTNP|nr:4-methyl-5(B-hydroxyethyl)-thiazol monophosphate biosynthesis enzyme, putative [Entamoeba nuttalli P19]EKE41713.1 4-methyl-5(B-hydroxyethyl)-thiazol monophosphate biosynthesis enzyme, putative [Entamoeba nuttalli P19]|eukprot:XP_008855938.1 4-methyl-5(B-hydroxyethyl)-thiazol monophosphate biosynthesis enzyme, putative [Entamoeba nuttalli P19]
MKALVVIANGSEELEAVTIIDILARAKIQVTTATINSNLETACSRGVKIMADKFLSECNEQYDVIAIPGGLPGADNLAGSQLLIQKIKEQLAANRFVAAICASPAIVLEGNGIIQGRKCTAYPSFQPKLANQSAVHQRVVVDNHLITSQAPGSAIEFALEIIRQLKGEEAMREVESPLVLSFKY